MSKAKHGHVIRDGTTVYVLHTNSLGETENLFDARVEGRATLSEREAFAEYIVRAVNSHDALVEVCQLVLISDRLDNRGTLIGDHLFKSIRSALKQAGEEA